jgi:hydroxymethylglutaryl-CoA synthase
MDVGVVSYGGYVPRFRITPEEIARVWGEDGKAMARNLNIRAKSVPGPDEDVITISVEAARRAMARCGVNPKDVGAIYVGSESHPYAVKPTATVIAEAIGAAPDLTAADYEFACKAGTAAIQTGMGLVASRMTKYTLAIGSDTSQGAPGDALEYSASAGGAAILIGGVGVVARINNTLSVTSDTPDFWRREGQSYPSHGGRFTGEPAYFKHITRCAERLFAEVGTKAEDYTHAVFHQPNGKFPVRVAKMLGFKEEQVKTGMLVVDIGNTYSGAVLLGLAAILDVAKPGDRIFMVGYGSGAGSDGFDLTVTPEIDRVRGPAHPTIASMVQGGTFLDYATYAKFRGKIRMAVPAGG